jgi:hypothetical protein
MMYDQKRDQAEDRKPEPHPSDQCSGERETDPSQNPCRHGYRGQASLGESDSHRLGPYQLTDAAANLSKDSSQVICGHDGKTGKGDGQADDN